MTGRFLLNLGLLAAPLAASAAQTNRLSVAMQNGRPLLQLANAAGQVFRIESTTNLAATGWAAEVTLTSDAAELSWADDKVPGPATFYRAAMVSDPTPFQTLQQALARACTNQGIVGASAAAVLAESGLWVGTFGTSDGLVPIRPQTPFEIASVTKTFVSATVLRLIEEGRLTLDDTVGTGA